MTPETLQRDLDRTLGEIAQWGGFDHSFIGLFSDTEEELEHSAEWWADDLQFPLPWWHQQLKALIRRQVEAEHAYTQAKLQISEERFRSLSMCSPVGIFIATREGLCVWSNPRLHQICGVTFESLPSRDWSRIVHPEDRERVRLEWTAAVDAGRGMDHEYRLRPSSHVNRWVHIRSAPLTTNQGVAIGHVGTVEDITERKQILFQLGNTIGPVGRCRDLWSALAG